MYTNITVRGTLEMKHTNEPYHKEILQQDFPVKVGYRTFHLLFGLGSV